MAIISLGTINKKILFAVFGGILKIIANIILYRTNVKMKEHPCILGINAGIGLSLAFIPLIFIKIRSKKYTSSNSSKSIIKNSLSNDFFITKTKRKLEEINNTKKKYIYILIVSILDFSQKFLTFFYVSLFLENFWIFDCFFILVFSFLILKTKVYSHHFISLTMIIIIGIILIIINYIDDKISFL